jgi:GntR family transcriptional repressor for pyruvate dehydrogenase complex
LAASLFHEKDDLIDIFFLRKIIEPEIAQMASDNGTLEEINELEEILKEQEKEVLSGRNPIGTDTDFHHLMARMARNRILERLLLALCGLLNKTREKYLQTEERKQKSLLGHQDILKAIKKKDGVGARQAMRRHLETVEASVFKKRKGGGQHL